MNRGTITKFTSKIVWCQPVHALVGHNRVAIKKKILNRCDHRGCDCDLSNRKVSPKNVFGASTGFEPIASALALQCNYNDNYQRS